MPRVVTERADVLPALAEVFRLHGYEGASLSLLGEATGLGRGSLYHFFPRGKEEMTSAVLIDIDAWFQENVFAPLRCAQEPAKAITAMFDAVEDYFRSGQRVCLIGVLALGDARERFATQVQNYFEQWLACLAAALSRCGRDNARAAAQAEEVVAGIQGAIVLARALDDPDAFSRAIARMRAGLLVP